MNYKIECIEYLLNEDCIVSRYYSLISFKYKIIDFANDKCLNFKDELYVLPDSELNKIFNNLELVKLFKSFLMMYDASSKKLKDLDKLSLSKDELNSFKKLYLLPGVKETRARLYYLSGFKSLKDIACSSADEIVRKCEETIIKNKLDYKAPLMKEVKTHIAVSKAFMSVKENY